MSDLLSEMSSDAGSTADKIDRLEDDQLDSIAKLANDAANLGQKIAATEELLRAQKRSLREITDERLPEALETMGLQKFTLTDGAEISVRPFYFVSIPKSRKDKAFQWLRDHEFGDLVKNNVTVTFGRGEDVLAKTFLDLCETKGFTPSQLQKVEPMVMKAWLRERVEAGDAVPLDLFGALVTPRATIKRSR